MSKRILIVEDEEAIAKMIAMNLRVAGMESVIFYDGDVAAQSLYKDHNYDLALLDVMVPGKDGFALLEILKPYGVPVIFLTAKDDINSKVAGLQGGAEDYMTKPFEVLELLVRIDKVLARTQRTETVMHFDDLTIDLDGRTVRKAGEFINLKPLEFDLLAVLVKNKNIAISRDDLLRLVWGADYYGETRTVDVHIGQLRKKLDLYDKIVTVPKMGYRLEGSR
ncbi:MAG: response regulator transcription factor [Clostridia bacterium]|nr:response regulator transcription factor [Clostridia bacterium]